MNFLLKLSCNDFVVLIANLSRFLFYRYKFGDIKIVEDGRKKELKERCIKKASGHKNIVS